MSKPFSNFRVCILSPIMYPEPRWVKSLANMISYSWMHGLPIYEFGMTERGVVDWSRNVLAEEAYWRKSEMCGKHYTHFLWLDADHVFNPDLACVLATHFSDKRVDGVSALYFGRTETPLPVAFVKDNSDDEFKHYPLIGVPPTLCEVDAFGFGAAMMKREIFGVVPKPWFTIDYRAGEDIAFCVRAKQHGFRFFLDGAYKLGHIGTAPVITEQHYLAHMDLNKEAYANKIKIDLGGKNE